MATEKEVVPAALANRRAAGPQTEAPTEQPSVVPPVDGAPPTPPVVTEKKWKFVKNFGVADIFNFEDGTSFTFRQIGRTTDYGVHPNSYVVTSDEKLAENLRKLTKNPHTGVVEVSV